MYKHKHPNNMKRKKKQPNFKRILIIGVIVELLSIVFFLSQLPELTTQLKQTVVLASTYKAKSFTELYFENNATLPKKFKPDSSYHFTFTIHNREQKDINYHYIISLWEGDNTSVLKSADVFVKDNEFVPIDYDFMLKKNTRSLVTVSLVDTNQKIAFWIEKQ